MVNDEVSGVIKISDAVVQRLKGEISGETSAAAAPKPAPAPTPEPKVEAPPPPPPVEVPPPPPVAVEVPPPPPIVEVPPPLPIVEVPPPPPIVEVPPPPPIVEVPPPPPIVEIPPPTPIVEVPPPPPPVEVSPPPPVEVPPPPPVTEPSPPPPVPEPVIAAPAPAALPPVAPAPSYVWQRPIIQYIEEPSLSALRVRAEKEEELKKLEDYWKDRLQKQEENHIANAKLTEEQILKSANHVETLFKPASSRDICSYNSRDSRLAVQTCYSENPSKPLLCREKVLEFSNCVSKSRLELLTPSG